MLNMHLEICNATEDLRVSIVFLLFHKHQRIDGKTTNDGEVFRQMNRNVLRHAPCSVGIFVDRNITGFQQPHGFDSVQHVAALFFGGPDDREALALCRWLANKQHFDSSHDHTVRSRGFSDRESCWECDNTRQ
ncbi:Cation/H(+) antiporter 2 [Raphanus sativus]|nr:Cation/H(+) antiporter 2 [Raphanus sativus]